MKTKFEVTEYDQEYLDKCVWMKKIKMRHAEKVIGSARNLIDYIDQVKNTDEVTTGTIAYVANFEFHVREHEMIRRRQVQSLMYLVQTRIL